MNSITLSLATSLAVGLLISLLVKNKFGLKQSGFRRVCIVVASLALIILGILNQNIASSICASIMLIVEFQTKSEKVSETT